jgi:type II secretory pathway pseudopilin PulG
MGQPDFGKEGGHMQERHNKLQNRRGERGFVLLVMGVTAVVVAGILGLAMDVGRTYITKNEAQAFADAAALAAARAEGEVLRIRLSPPSPEIDSSRAAGRWSWRFRSPAISIVSRPSSPSSFPTRRSRSRRRAIWWSSRAR